MRKIAPPKIMVVDDEPHVVEYVTEMLRNINFEVVASANDGVTALAKLREFNPDMAVLDITMPGMTGDELVTELKKTKPEIKIVMLTSRNTIDMVKLCKDKGVDGYILKSEEGSTVSRKIQEIWFNQFFEAEDE